MSFAAPAFEFAEPKTAGGCGSSFCPRSLNGQSTHLGCSHEWEDAQKTSAHACVEVGSIPAGGHQISERSFNIGTRRRPMRDSRQIAAPDVATITGVRSEAFYSSQCFVIGTRGPRQPLHYFSSALVSSGYLHRPSSLAKVLETNLSGGVEGHAEAPGRLGYMSNAQPSRYQARPAQSFPMLKSTLELAALIALVIWAYVIL